MKQDFNKFLAITKNVYIQNTFSWGFLLMVLSPLFLVGFGVFIQLYTPSPEDYTIAILSDDSEIRQTFIDIQELPWTLDLSIDDRDDAEDKLITESIHGIIDIQTSDSVTILLTQSDGLFDTNQALIEEQVSRALLHTEYAIELPQASSDIQHVRIDDGTIVYGDINEYRIQQGFVMAAAVGLVLLLTNYATSILSEIASEKGTRMMEIILSATTARIHLLGKLSGIILVIITQFAVYALPIVVSFLVIPNAGALLQAVLGTRYIWNAIQPVFWITAGFSVVGLALYVMLAALLGSLASRQEDVAKLSAPISLLSFTGYMVSLSISTGTEHPLFDLMSYVPFFAPQIVPLQVFHGQLSIGHAIGILIWCMLFTVLLFVFTLITYQTNVLSYSDKSIRQALLQSWTILKDEYQLKSNK